MQMKITKTILMFICMALLSSCDKAEVQNAVPKNELGHGGLLAEVNGVSIYEQSLENFLLDLFGEYQLSSLDQQGREKALQSLVASQALADLSAKNLDKQQLSLIESKTERYRENLLINAYVKATVVSEVFTHKMVVDYYNSHLERFGQKKVRLYELISTKTVLPAGIRDDLLSKINQYLNVTQAINLKEVSQRLNKHNYQLQYHKGVLGETILQQKVRDFIAAQKLNHVSNVNFIDGKAYVVNVYAEKVLPAKTLNEVAGSIRKNLAMIQLKRAVKGLSETAIKQAVVVYHNK